MQIKKAGVVAAGALATVAVMGAPAAAAPAPQADASAFTKASALNLARGMFQDNVWDPEVQPFIGAGSGSKGSALAWQICGATAVAGVGITVDAVDPDTVIGGPAGGCNNANALLNLQSPPALIGALNDTAIYVAPWQACGSTTVGGIILTVDALSPETVIGGCRNANVVISGAERDDDHYGSGHNGHGLSGHGLFGHFTESTTVDEEAAKAQTRQGGQKAGGQKAVVSKDADKVRTALAGAAKAAKPAKTGDARHWQGGRHFFDQPGIASVGTGSVGSLAPWQLCAGSAIWGVGVVVDAVSPNTVLGDCDNNNVWIDQPADQQQTLLSLLDYTHVSALSWQVCGSDTVAGVGVTVSALSPDTVMGTCNNDNTVIH